MQDVNIKREREMIVINVLIKYRFALSIYYNQLTVGYCIIHVYIYTYLYK